MNFKGEGKPRVIHGASFETELEKLINRYSKENGSNTPDFILAEYISDCLKAFDKAVARRAEWYGRLDRPGVCKICGGSKTIGRDKNFDPIACPCTQEEVRSS